MVNVPIPYLQTPATIANEALDRIGASDKVIGDISDGTTIAEAVRRNYGQLLRRLLRTAHWNFARKLAPLTLLGDATGLTANASSQVDSPWTYAYAWPIDAVAARWMPQVPPQVNTNPPLMTGGVASPPMPFLPGRFLVSSSNLYPLEVGDTAWAQGPDLRRTEGAGAINRRIILTDIQNAWLVYTRFVPVIEEWDSLFRESAVALLALVLAPIAIDDPKERLVQRNAMIAIAKNAVNDARVANGNESGYPDTVDHTPNWIAARSGGLLASGLDAYSGGTYLPYDGSMSWAGAVF